MSVLHTQYKYINRHGHTHTQRNNIVILQSSVVQVTFTHAPLSEISLLKATATQSIYCESSLSEKSIEYIVLHTGNDEESSPKG